LELTSLVELNRAANPCDGELKFVCFVFMFIVAFQFEVNVNNMRVSIHKFQQMKNIGEPIPMITAYDYSSAYLVENAGIPLILVGDSLGQVVMGHATTIPVTLEDMLSHIKMVVRGTTSAHIVGDMPFLTYQINGDEAVRNAGSLLKYGGCQSVKLEGGSEISTTMSRIVRSGIPVMGHIGFTPQSVYQLGIKVQGKNANDANSLINDALAIQEAGAYAIVLELIPKQLAEIITKKLTIPTIGIGAGAYCDGQVQVFHDLLGLNPNFTPKHAKKYVDLAQFINKAVRDYIEDVKIKEFASDEMSFSNDETIKFPESL